MSAAKRRHLEYLITLLKSFMNALKECVLKHGEVFRKALKEDLKSEEDDTFWLSNYVTTTKPKCTKFMEKQVTRKTVESATEVKM